MGSRLQFDTVGRSGRLNVAVVGHPCLLASLLSTGGNARNFNRVTSVVTVNRNQCEGTSMNSTCFRLLNLTAVLLAVNSLILPATLCAGDENDFYRVVDVSVKQARTDSRAAKWKPAPDDVVLEISGMAFMDEDRLAVCTRKGEIWILTGVLTAPEKPLQYHRFATSLHEPLGLLYDDGDFITTQRSEVTRVKDTNGDGHADEFQTVSKGWGVSGHYHEFVFGPEKDAHGDLWITLNIATNVKGQEQINRSLYEPTLQVRQAKWRGWGLRISKDGKLHPVCGGMRSPSGIGSNLNGDMFYSDQQGHWVSAGSLHHMREGVFFHHPESLASMNQPESTIKGVRRIPNGVPFPLAVAQFPQLKPPAVWFPYKKMGQSATDIIVDDSEGKFGPFHGQLFVGEFTQASVNRVFLEKVGGEYQGACFPFRRGFASAVLRLCQASDGSMMSGLTNRGWSSLGSASYGLQRLVWTGETPFEIQEMRATPTGFDLQFTKAVDPNSATNVASYLMDSYTYLYHNDYGSDEIQKQRLVIRKSELLQDGKTVRLTVNGLRRMFVHELLAGGIRSTDGEPLLHTQAFYTLNRIPRR